MEKSAIKIDFTKPIGSMSVSGHKFLGKINNKNQGCPMPSGIVLTYKKFMKNILNNFNDLNTDGFFN
jgi:hypothetical protein